jgi:hypothetical protein
VLLGKKAVRRDRIRVRSINGEPVPTYGDVTLHLRITDDAGETRERSLKLFAADLDGFDIILGFPWLWLDEPIPCWSKGIWSFLMRDSLIEVVLQEKFIQSLTLQSQVWIAMNDIIIRLTRKSSDDAPEEIQLGDDSSDLSLLATGTESLPAEYEPYRSIFSDEEARALPEHSQMDHAIDTTANPPYGPIYNLSADELAALRRYLDEQLKKGYIRPLKSPAGAPILFVPKKNSRLHLCVDYLGLNKATVKNQYPLPLILEILDRVSGSKIFSKLDLRDVYYRIRIRKGDEWKTAFRTRYGHFKYTVMPFGLTNAPATFQAHINSVLAGLINVCYIIYLDDILIYFPNKERHQHDVSQVL